MQMLYKTTCLPLNEHRFTETSRRGPKRWSQSTQTVLQPYFGIDRSTKQYWASSAEHALTESFVSHWRTPQNQEFHKSGSDLKKTI